MMESSSLFLLIFFITTVNTLQRQTVFKRQITRNRQTTSANFNIQASSLNIKYLFADITTDYTTAAALCNSVTSGNTTLVSVADAWTSEFIYDYFKSYTSDVPYWTKVPDVTKFKYNTDAIVWNTTQVKALSGVDCVVVSGRGVNTRFRNVPCFERQRFVCEQIAPVENRLSWFQSPFGTNYAISRQEYTYPEADKVCRLSGGTLAKIMSNKEDKWISQVLVDNGFTSVWTGAYSLINRRDAQT